MVADGYNGVAHDFLALIRVGPHRPDLALLARLVQGFARLPYENVTKIVRAHAFVTPEGRLRMPDIILSDHMAFGTGGTCFSLTFFFEQILRHAGFDVAPVFCDRSYGPDTHCALMAELRDGAYLVDPGYLLEAPLLIPPRGESVQRGGMQTVRLVRLGETAQLLLFTERNGARKLRYRLRDVPVAPDCFRQRWIDSFDWAMMRHLCVSQMIGGNQLYIRDGVMRKKRRDEEHQQSVRQQLGEAIAGTFGIDPRIVDLAHEYLRR